MDAGDRCDQCGARAYVSVVLKSFQSSELLLCGHHYAVNEAKLVGSLMITDFRDQILGAADDSEH
jgi:hypothetical protein